MEAIAAEIFWKFVIDEIVNYVSADNDINICLDAENFVVSWNLQNCILNLANFSDSAD